MSVDIRQLLEQLSKLSKESLQEQAQSNVRQLPLGAPKGKIDPGTQAMNQMGVMLTKPGEKPAEPAAPPKPVAAQPGQKNLFALPKIEPETPAMMPKQPWLDPKGAKEPAFMRKAAGVKPAEPLGVIGGTGPDAKFAKLPPANEPSIPKATASVIKMPKMPSMRGMGGSEYVNVPTGAVGLWKDAQYAKDVAAQLKKFPDDKNLRAEWDSLQQKVAQNQAPGATPDILGKPSPKLAPDAATSEPGKNAPKAAAPVVVPPVPEPRKIEPATVAYDTDKWMQQHGVVKEFANEFENYIDSVLKEQGIPGLIRRLFVRGKPKAPEAPPTVTPQKPVQMPKDVETPAYIRKGEKGAAPEPKKPAQAANDPSMPPPAKGDIGNVVPGPKPIEPPKSEPIIPRPAPGKPGSATKQRRKLVPPVLPAEEPGGGKEPPTPVQPIRVDEPDSDTQTQVPSKVDLPTLQSPLPPNSPFVVSGPETSGSAPSKPETPGPSETPPPRPMPNATPLTKDQLDRINRNDRAAAAAQAEKEKAQVEPTRPAPEPATPAKPAPSTAPSKPGTGTGGTGGSGGGQGGGQGPGVGSGTGSGGRIGYDPDAWMQQHGVVKESRAIKYLLKDFKKFVNKPRT